jgi:hypothetical protein
VRKRSIVVGITIVALASGLGLVPASAESEDEVRRGLEAIREATVEFHDPAVAVRNGYHPEGPCVESPDGGMGVHYVKARLIDSTVRLRQPEMLLYEPTQRGPRLVGVEYFVPDADQDLSTDDDRPFLLGQPFDGPMPGHEPGMPIHYDLHVWVWLKNPSGDFAAFNPRVDCP